MQLDNIVQQLILLVQQSEESKGARTCLRLKVYYSPH